VDEGKLNMAVQGHYDPAFKSVREVFEENFTERGEVGASVCLKDAGGRVLVDLWGLFLHKGRDGLLRAALD
jgi:hypothetical protein